LRRGDGATDI